MSANPPTDGEQNGDNVKNDYLKYGTILIVAVLILSFVYPTIYRYDKYDQKIPVRINRITGKAEMLFLNGWAAATSTPTPQTTEKPLKTASPSPSPTPIPIYNGETFSQYYDRVIKEIPGDSAPSRNTLFFRWERARLGLLDKLMDPKDYFTIGSTKEDVKKVMGPPTSIDSYFDTWYYDTSTITFSNGKVKEYHDSLNKLLVR